GNVLTPAHTLVVAELLQPLVTAQYICALTQENGRILANVLTHVTTLGVQGPSFSPARLKFTCALTQLYGSVLDATPSRHIILLTTQLRTQAQGPSLRWCVHE
ncbi:hypothetical protein SARC_16886, partial [Sphaeroforma arctica JP610]